MFTLFIIILAFYLAFNLGANDVANAMGTSVGSKAITLKQALIVAGVLEFTGAVLFGHEVTSTLATGIANPNLFITQPQMLVVGMVSVLISCGLWLQIATAKGLPVSSSHAVVGAIAGFCWVALGINAVEWGTIGLITVGWVLTPVISGGIAAIFYSQIRRWILNSGQQLSQLNEWIPWLSAALVGIFGVIVLPKVAQPIQVWLGEAWGWQIPIQTIVLAIGGVMTGGLSLYLWKLLERQLLEKPEKEKFVTEKLEQPEQLEQIEPTTSNYPSSEIIFSKYQVLSACFVAFAHGSNDVGNAIAPLATIIEIHRLGTIPQQDLQIQLWILVLGGLGIVAGLAILGKNVIATIGGKIIELKPSDGFCAELATATTILLASRLGLPVSTSHALIGGVVGIGLVKNPQTVKFSTLQSIFTAWVVTIPVSAGLAAIIFGVWEKTWGF